MRMGIWPAGPSISRFSTERTGSGHPAAALRQSAAKMRASGGCLVSRDASPSAAEPRRNLFAIGSSFLLSIRKSAYSTGRVRRETESIARDQTIHPLADRNEGRQEKSEQR